jgi:serine/threonine protein kinase
VNKKSLTRFSDDDNVAVLDRERVPYSQSYQSPEIMMPNGRLTSQYDVWALGCVFLEFVSWYVGGYERIEEMECERSAGHFSSSFFFIKVKSNPPSVSAELKPVVVNLIMGTVQWRRHLEELEYVRKSSFNETILQLTLSCGSLLIDNDVPS